MLVQDLLKFLLINYICVFGDQLSWWSVGGSQLTRGQLPCTA